MGVSAEHGQGAIPAIAEAMETVRQKMIIFRYQLLHIKSGKTQITRTLHVVRPDIKKYEDVAKQLKSKMRNRRILLEEKKTVPTIQILRHRELSQKIVTVTKDIEKLKSEKALLLNQFDCADDHGMAEVKQRIASMESSLEKLDQQETKYTDELEATLAQYGELQQQAADIDSTELETARQAIRPNMEREATQHLQATYQKKFDFRLLTKSRKDVVNLLGETVESVSIWQELQQLPQKEHKQSLEKGHSQER